MKPLNAFLVGGAVRDRLLGYDSHDRDWVVIGETPEAMLNRGFAQVGSDFPVFLHPRTKEEYALARTERKKGHGYRGFECQFSPSVTLEEDLQRRDLTINAIAMSEQGDLIDPFQGQQDLDAKLLRHVSDAFAEDPLRILRVARFAARFKHLGFSIAEQTMQLMHNMVQQGEAGHLKAERVWQETQSALGERSPWIYFEVLRQTGCLGVVFPELDALFGIPQPEKYHPEIDCGAHALLSLQQASILTTDKPVRFAALIHDLGKALTPKAHWPSHHGHEAKGLKPIKALCTRLRAPNSVRELALLVSEFHTHIHRADELKASTMLKVLKQCDAFRRPERFTNILLCSEADARGRTGLETQPYPQRALFAEAAQRAQAIDFKPLIKEGLEGEALGQRIDQLRQQAIQRFIEGSR